jgi:hypothetical protein
VRYVEVRPEPDERTCEWYATRATTDDRLGLAIIDEQSDLLVGEVVLNEFDANVRRRDLDVDPEPGVVAALGATRRSEEYAGMVVRSRRVVVDGGGPSAVSQLDSPPQPA